MVNFACSQGRPIVSYLLFVDDSLIFCKASIEDFSVVKSLLDNYAAALSQKVILDKSAMTFSPNVVATLQSKILGCFGMTSSSSHDKYLVLPTLINCNKRSTFDAIK